MSNFLKRRSLFLIGMMGAGKTTVGKLLAQHLNYRFFDTDTLIEQVAGQSVSGMFADQGEPAFRQLESQVLAELSTYLETVVATGGGIVLKPENWGYLRHGIVIWLDFPLDQLYQRLTNDTTRPLLQTADLAAKLETLLTQRRPVYEQADLRLSLTTETPEQVVAKIWSELPLILKPDAAQG